jgi:hypothetical protein
MQNGTNAHLNLWPHGNNVDQSDIITDNPIDSDLEEDLGASEDGDPTGAVETNSINLTGANASSSGGSTEPTSAPSGSSISTIAPQGSQNTDSQNANDFSKKRIYPSDFDGRFLVFIREWKKALPHVTISRYLCKKYTSSILQITKVHKQKIRVECANAFTANLLVADAELNKDFRVSIPADVVEINGVISISNDLNTLDLVNFGAGVFGNPSIPSVRIFDAYRMRKSFSQNGKTFRLSRIKFE